jgi:pyrroline-5-carboxylate reductase
MVAKRIAVIGAGNMGTALLRGILASGWGTKKNLIASHSKRPKGAVLASELGIVVTDSNREAARQAQIVILAVKPQILESVLKEIRPARRRGVLFDRGGISDVPHRGGSRGFCSGCPSHA